MLSGLATSWAPETLVQNPRPQATDRRLWKSFGDWWRLLYSFSPETRKLFPRFLHGEFMFFLALMEGDIEC
jgi:hypothetical protein